VAIEINLDNVQETLVSGTNIKTVNSQSLLGSGDIVISGGGSVNFGLNGEIPFMNATNDDFDYTANFTLTSGILKNVGRMDLANASRSLYVGTQAGDSEDSQSGYRDNIGLGYRALRYNTSGRNNIAIGWYSLDNISLGSDNNVAVGNQTLSSLGNYSDDNTALGGYALANLDSGYDNVAIGRDAGAKRAVGFDLESCSGGTFIGYDTRALNNASLRETVIGFEARGNGNYSVTIGASNNLNNYFRGALNVKGSGSTSATTTMLLENSSGTDLFKVLNDGKINMGVLPTSSSGLSSGDIWNDGGTLKIV